MSGVRSVSGMWRESESVECGVSESVECEWGVNVVRSGVWCGVCGVMCGVRVVCKWSVRGV